MTVDQVRQKHLPKVGYNALTSLYVLECRCGEFKAQDYDFANAGEEFDEHITEQMDRRTVTV